MTSISDRLFGRIYAIPHDMGDDLHPKNGAIGSISFRGEGRSDMVPPVFDL